MEIKKQKLILLFTLIIATILLSGCKFEKSTVNTSYKDCYNDCKKFYAFDFSENKSNCINEYIGDCLEKEEILKERWIDYPDQDCFGWVYDDTIRGCTVSTNMEFEKFCLNFCAGEVKNNG